MVLLSRGESTVSPAVISLTWSSVGVEASSPSSFGTTRAIRTGQGSTTRALLKTVRARIRTRRNEKSFASALCVPRRDEKLHDETKCLSQLRSPEYETAESRVHVHSIRIPRSVRSFEVRVLRVLRFGQSQNLQRYRVPVRPCEHANTLSCQSDTCLECYRRLPHPRLSFRW